MTQTLKVQVGDLKGRMQLTGRGHANAKVAIDYSPPLGEDNGFTSLELLMVSLASCSSHSIQYAIGTMGLKLEDIKAEATGQRRIDQHPTVLTKIELLYEIKGAGLRTDSIEKAIHMAEDEYCPVWAMLKKEVEITWKYQLKPE
jgi:putative redox protein